MKKPSICDFRRTPSGAQVPHPHPIRGTGGTGTPSAPHSHPIRGTGGIEGTGGTGPVRRKSLYGKPFSDEKKAFACGGNASRAALSPNLKDANFIYADLWPPVNSHKIYMPGAKYTIRPKWIGKAQHIWRSQRESLYNRSCR